MEEEDSEGVEEEEEEEEADEEQEESAHRPTEVRMLSRSAPYPLADLRAVPSQLEGYRLKLSAKAESGYEHVTRAGAGSHRWHAKVRLAGKLVFLGGYDSPAEAALAIAKHHDTLDEAVATAEPQVQLQAADGPSASTAPLRRRGAAVEDEDDEGVFVHPPSSSRLLPPPRSAL